MTITINPLKIKEPAIASRLMLKVFREYALPDMPGEQSYHAFARIVSPEALICMVTERHVILMARYEGEPAGVIAFRNNHRHLLLMFVDGRFHGKGVARALWDAGRKRCLALLPGDEPFTVNSSPYALEVYRKFGFTATGPQVTAEKDGIVYTPMTRPVDLD